MKEHDEQADNNFDQIPPSCSSARFALPEYHVYKINNNILISDTLCSAAVDSDSEAGNMHLKSNSLSITVT